jgi:hypothetical protein
MEERYGQPRSYGMRCRRRCNLARCVLLSRRSLRSKS